MLSNRTAVRRSAVTALAVAAGLVLAACGGDGGGGHDMASMESGSTPSQSTSVEGGDHNTADVDFAEEMIGHHRQAVEMAELADSRASSGEVKELAEQIKGAQDPEIETMSDWLTSWGEEVPEDMTGMDHDMSGGMPGMMSPADMDELEQAKGEEFDTMFLEMMVEHHQGAITMARQEKADGEFGPAKKLADAVVSAQSAEIKEMNRLLGKR